MKVIVIDDDFHIQRIVEARLKAENFKVLKASDGIEGLRLIYDFMPDVVLLDIMMPTIDGHAVLHCIKKDDKIQHIPVIMMTAKREKADVVRAADGGAADYIIKPIDFRLMLKKIHDAVAAARDVAPKAPAQPAVTPTISGKVQELSELAYEMDALAASTGIPKEPRAEADIPEAFEMKEEVVEDVTILEMIGVLHDTDLAMIRGQLTSRLAGGRKRFVFDISGIKTIDAGRVMTLQEIMKEVADRLGEIRVVETDEKRWRFLRQCNFHLDHPLFSSVAEALKTYRSPGPGPAKDS